MDRKLDVNPVVLHLKLWHLTHEAEFLSICNDLPLPTPLAYNLTNVPLRDALREVIQSAVKRPALWEGFVARYAQIYPEIEDISQLSLEDFFVDPYINPTHQENIASLPSPILLSPHAERRLDAFARLLIPLASEDFYQLSFLLGIRLHMWMPMTLLWSDISLWSDAMRDEVIERFKARNPRDPTISDDEYVAKMEAYIAGRKRIYSPPTTQVLRGMLDQEGGEQAFELDEADLLLARNKVRANQFLEMIENYSAKREQHQAIIFQLEKAYMLL